MPSLPIIQGNELLAALQRAGFVKIRQKGSHVRLKHPDGRIITVPIHSGSVIGRGLLRKILRDSELTIEDLNRLLHK
jgi:predicted RNA binding protein YcfA (HicA-like mRNA interferase family)